MSACEDQINAIILDVHGELDPVASKSLLRHLDICEGCRQERQQLLGLLHEMKAAMQSPGLTESEVEQLTNNLKSKLKKKRRPTLHTGLPRIIPAMAAACILVVIAAIVGYNLLRPGDAIQPSVGIQANQFKKQDLELFQHLDLLKDMDSIQKLVQAVDDSTLPPAQEKDFRDSRGMNPLIYGEQYA